MAPRCLARAMPERPMGACTVTARVEPEPSLQWLSPAQAIEAGSTGRRFRDWSSLADGKRAGLASTCIRRNCHPAIEMVRPHACSDNRQKRSQAGVALAAGHGIVADDPVARHKIRYQVACFCHNAGPFNADADRIADQAGFDKAGMPGKDGQSVPQIPV